MGIRQKIRIRLPALDTATTIVLYVYTITFWQEWGDAGDGIASAENVGKIGGELAMQISGALWQARQRLDLDEVETIEFAACHHALRATRRR